MKKGRNRVAAIAYIGIQYTQVTITHKIDNNAMKVTKYICSLVNPENWKILIFQLYQFSS